MGTAVIETPAGYSGLCWTPSGLVVLNLPAPSLHDAEIELREAIESLPQKPSGKNQIPGRGFDLANLEREIIQYFKGKPVDLSFPVDWGYYTEFQKRVLQQVCSLKWGQANSYGQIAADIGSPRGARAVGSAVGSNRVLVIVPCHRVIARNRGLGGFGGGLDWKRKLLGLEGIIYKG